VSFCSTVLSALQNPVPWLEKPFHYIKGHTELELNGTHTFLALADDVNILNKNINITNKSTKA
jgi:hypothetical protein